MKKAIVTQVDSRKTIKRPVNHEGDTGRRRDLTLRRGVLICRAGVFDETRINNALVLKKPPRISSGRNLYRPVL